MSDGCNPSRHDDHDTGGFFEAAARGELVVRACSKCGAILHVPRAYCHTCGSWDGEWRPSAAPAPCTAGPSPTTRSTRPTRCPTRSCSSTSTTCPGCACSATSTAAPTCTIGMPMQRPLRPARRRRRAAQLGAASPPPTDPTNQEPSPCSNQRSTATRSSTPTPTSSSPTTCGRRASTSSKWGDKVPHVSFDEKFQEDAWYFGDKRIGAAAVGGPGRLERVPAAAPAVASTSSTRPRGRRRRGSTSWTSTASGAPCCTRTSPGSAPARC